jgi:hypothetical protein
MRPNDSSRRMIENVSIDGGPSRQHRGSATHSHHRDPAGLCHTACILVRHCTAAVHCQWLMCDSSLARIAARSHGGSPCKIGTPIQTFGNAVVKIKSRSSARSPIVFTADFAAPIPHCCRMMRHRRNNPVQKCACGKSHQIGTEKKRASR